MHEFKRSKPINKDFKPKIIPLINGLNSKFLSNLQYPTCLQPCPPGIKIFIRSGFLRFGDGDIVINLNFKEKIKLLIQKSRSMKITLECVVGNKDMKMSENHIKTLLCDYNGDIKDLELYIMDMVLEESPEVLEYSVRTNSLKFILKHEEIGTFPTIVQPVILKSNKDFQDFINSFVIFEGYKNFIIASPKSLYKFGDVEDLFNGDGGIAQIDGESIFKAKIIEVIPKIITLKGKDSYIADHIIVNYCGEKVKIYMEDVSIITAAKTWENREEIKNHFIVFTGMLLPGYTYPKYRKFIRFENNL